MLRNPISSWLNLTEEYDRIRYDQNPFWSAFPIFDKHLTGTTHLQAKTLKQFVQPIPSPFICVHLIHEVSLFIFSRPTEQKTAPRSHK